MKKMRPRVRGRIFIARAHLSMFASVPTFMLEERSCRWIRALRVLTSSAACATRPRPHLHRVVWLRRLRRLLAARHHVHDGV